MADQLPHNDPDLTLAQQIGEALEKGTSLAGLEDPLIEDLVEHKKIKHQLFTTTSSGKQEVWNKIEAATGTANASVTHKFSSKTLRWAAAAVIIIGAIFSFVYLQFYQQPDLVAQSNSSIQTIELRDGSLVTLRPYSKLYSMEDNGNSMRYQLDGEGLFDVTDNPNRRFSVETDNGKVSVLGTRFTVSSWGNKMQVYLQEGSVQVQSLDADSSVVLQAGQSASVNDPTAIPEIHQAANVEEFTDWLNQELVFENKSAKQIVSELEQQFNISIELPTQIANTTLSGRLDINTLQTSLDDLELVLGGTFVKTGTRKYRFQSN